MRLHLVRHARTEYNAAGRLQGWCDSPLTDDGLPQLRATAAHLADVELTAAWASPSGRTMATAREILRHHEAVRLRADDALREYSFGEWEARPEPELYGQVEPRLLFADVIAGKHPGLAGGEAADAYLARVGDAFARIGRAHPEGDVLVVSHGVTLFVYLALIGYSGGTPLGNCSVTTVEIIENRATAVQVGFLPKISVPYADAVS
ncbi:histidine phosphatase family protein [Streptomyces sp. S3(2020)]|uniref:histidine phosphatase family protein n=1 Tax=Streptomyces sp. S3(2020) TaxID=2732044 RepID=UPI0014889613|nr:histidine phosphatase family protein [Streptomyces sp. S3(2020)]NNN31393.1 histidine phosphatase family protein [Streptomyces sp. S3(2020)]